jgi:hypothetical protein
MKPTTRITDAGPKRCLNGIFEIPESFSTGSKRVVAPCLLVLWNHIMHHRVTQPAIREKMRLAEDSALNACLKRKRIGCPLPESGPFSMKLRLSWLRSQKFAFTDVNQFTSTPHV